MPFTEAVHTPLKLKTPPDGREGEYVHEGGELMKDYKLTVEVLEERIAPGMSLGGQG